MHAVCTFAACSPLWMARGSTRRRIRRPARGERPPLCGSAARRRQPPGPYPCATDRMWQPPQHKERGPAQIQNAPSRRHVWDALASKDAPSLWGMLAASSPALRQWRGYRPGRPPQHVSCEMDFSCGKEEARRPRVGWRQPPHYRLCLPPTAMLTSAASRTRTAHLSKSSTAFWHLETTSPAGAPRIVR